MIAIRLMGGLGNQMFQYATARALANHRNTELFLDKVWFEHINQVDTPRHYELDCFAADQRFLPKRLSPVLESDHFYHGKFGKFKLKVNQKTHRSQLIVFQEKKFNFDKQVLLQPDNTYLIGYFQSEKYFANIRDLLLKDFNLIAEPDNHNKALLKKIASSQSVSLHVRRGDYVSNKDANKFHGTKGHDYYDEAIKLVAKKIKKPTFFVISDDPEWCKQNIKLSYETVYVDNNSVGSEDMRLMRSCRHNIIANSSFSWWGAWLNENPDKIVIAPSQWFDDPTVNTSDVIPGSWQKI